MTQERRRRRILTAQKGRVRKLPLEYCANPELRAICIDMDIKW